MRTTKLYGRDSSIDSFMADSIGRHGAFFAYLFTNRRSKAHGAEFRQVDCDAAASDFANEGGGKITCTSHERAGIGQ